MDPSLIAELAELAELRLAEANSRIVKVLECPLSVILVAGQQDQSVKLVLLVTEVVWNAEMHERPTGSVELSLEKERRLEELSVLVRFRAELARVRAEFSQLRREEAEVLKNWSIVQLLDHTLGYTVTDESCTISEHCDDVVVRSDRVEYTMRITNVDWHQTFAWKEDVNETPEIDPFKTILTSGSYSVGEKDGKATLTSGDVDLDLTVTNVTWFTDKPERPSGPVRLAPEKLRRLDELLHLLLL
jgi:hypothetical protein